MKTISLLFFLSVFSSFALFAQEYGKEDFIGQVPDNGGGTWLGQVYHESSSGDEKEEKSEKEATLRQVISSDDFDTLYSGERKEKLYG